MQHIRNPLANGLNIGLIIAFALLLHITAFGWQSLDPASTAWLLRDEPAQHYLGWYFFRHEPWHWPLGRIEGFGLPAGFAAILADADLLILLTDQQGLFTADPRSNPDAVLIPEVELIDDELRALAGDSVSGLGTGGMATKLQAADIATRAGVEVVIASGKRPELIGSLARGEKAGTRFLAQANPLESRKSWILAGPPPHGELYVDAGAQMAVHDKGSSLLPKGIVKVQGDFERGDVVRVMTAEGRELARGISRYNAADMAQIAGKHSDDIESCLGYGYGAVAIHRDDLVLL